MEGTDLRSAKIVSAGANLRPALFKYDAVILSPDGDTRRSRIRAAGAEASGKAGKNQLLAVRLESSSLIPDIYQQRLAVQGFHDPLYFGRHRM